MGLHEDIKFLFANVNDWLKFIEAKHTALIALNGAAIIGLTQSVHSSIKNPIVNYVSVYWLIPLLIISITVSLISMSPLSTRFAKIHRSRRLKPENLLYFGHISALDAANFESALLIALSITPPLPVLDQQLVVQIHINSSISFGKNRLFQWASAISLGALFSSFIAVELLRWFPALLAAARCVGFDIPLKEL